VTPTCTEVILGAPRAGWASDAIQWMHQIGEPGGWCKECSTAERDGDAPRIVCGSIPAYPRPDDSAYGVNHRCERVSVAVEGMERIERGGSGSRAARSGGGFRTRPTAPIPHRRRGRPTRRAIRRYPSPPVAARSTDPTVLARSRRCGNVPDEAMTWVQPHERHRARLGVVRTCSPAVPRTVRGRPEPHDPRRLAQPAIGQSSSPRSSER
jgi:hypothetical protein